MINIVVVLLLIRSFPTSFFNNSVIVNMFGQWICRRVVNDMRFGQIVFKYSISIYITSRNVILPIRTWNISRSNWIAAIPKGSWETSLMSVQTPCLLLLLLGLMQICFLEEEEEHDDNGICPPSNLLISLTVIGGTHSSL